MKKLESSLKNMVLVLTGITVITVGILAFVNELTKAPIAAASAKTLSDAVSEVVHGFDNDPIAEQQTVSSNGSTYIVYPASKGGESIGAAVQSSAMGFGGELTILIGFDKAGNINDYSILSHSETPGLGDKAGLWFKKGAKGDIIGKNPGKDNLTVSKDGGDIDAITASTITSRAFLSAVNAAYAVFNGGAADATSGASQQSGKSENKSADTTSGASQQSGKSENK